MESRRDCSPAQKCTGHPFQSADTGRAPSVQVQAGYYSLQAPKDHQNTRRPMDFKAAEITLVEVKYTRDTDPSRTMRDPHAQHSRMHELLRGRHPTAIIERRNIKLGVAGAIYTEATIRQLELL